MPNAMQMLPSPTFFKTKLARLATYSAGIGETSVVLWPSIFTDHTIFLGLVAKLTDTHRVILVDGPGHGQSDGPINQFDNKACADALLTVMDHHGIDSAIVGGTSWGGMVGAELALKAPERVDKLLLMNTPFLMDGSRPSLRSKLIAMGARWMLRSRIYTNGVAKEFFGEVATSQASYVEQFHQHLASANPQKLANAVKSVFTANAPLLPRLAGIEAPALVIGGEEDAMYPLNVQRDAANALPNGQFTAVPGKHISLICAPDETISAIGEFVNDD
ncbi:MAG: alpha/beta hydrolase [Pseudomonadota bacterium]